MNSERTEDAALLHKPLLPHLYSSTWYLARRKPVKNLQPTEENKTITTLATGSKYLVLGTYSNIIWSILIHRTLATSHIFQRRVWKGWDTQPEVDSFFILHGWHWDQLIATKYQVLQHFWHCTQCLKSVIFTENDPRLICQVTYSAQWWRVNSTRTI